MEANQLRTRIGEWLGDRWSGVYTNQQSVFIVPRIRDTACFVEVEDLSLGVPRINFHAPILLGLHDSPQLYGVVAFATTGHPFGTIAATIENDLVNLDYDYSVIGDEIIGTRLNFFVEYVATTALEFIDKLRPAFGGRTVYEDAG